MYRAGILSRTEFDIPVVCIGNLAVGGTGKTPHIEWLIRALKSQCRPAVLSRGYKRKTTGYLAAGPESDALQLGDEPFQLHLKFPEMPVAVCENRVMGIPYLLGDFPETELILMDDGFQHLPLKAGYAILLTDYNNLFTDDYLMPSGLLREFRSGYQRADCIIVSKCPSDLSLSEKTKLSNKINPLPHQRLYFSSLKYDDPVCFHGTALQPKPDTTVLAVSGIANANPFEQEIKRRFKNVSCKRYSDHHTYQFKDLIDLKERVNAMPGDTKIMVCTEKDMTKIKPLLNQSDWADIPFFYLPLEVELHGNAGNEITAHIHQLVQTYRLRQSDTTNL